MTTLDDYEHYLMFLETVPEDMSVPERSAARPRGMVIDKLYNTNDKKNADNLQTFNEVDECPDVSETLLVEFTFNVRDDSSDEHEVGSPKESIFSECQSPKVPALHLNEDEDCDDLDLFLGELDDVEIQEITNVLTFAKGQGQVRIN